MIFSFGFFFSLCTIEQFFIDSAHLSSKIFIKDAPLLHNNLNPYLLTKPLLVLTSTRFYVGGCLDVQRTKEALCITANDPA